MKFFFFRKSNVGYILDAPPRERQARNHAEIERTSGTSRRDDGTDDEEAEGNERSATSVYTGAKNTMGSRIGSDPKPRVTASLF